MFALTKILGALLMPLSLVLLAALLGAALLFTRRARLGRRVVLGTLAALYLLGLEATAGLLLAPLERQYPALLEPRAQVAAPVSHIVVLGEGHRLDPRLPVTAQLNANAAVRLLEGVRLQRAFPDATLVLGGGAVFGETPNSAVMHRLLRAVGLDPGAVVRLETPRNTVEEARAVAGRVGGPGAGRVVLVTEASHMPRAVALFRGQGLDPVPAPTRHRVRGREAGAGPRLRDFLPSAEGLRMSERAFHEYLGLAWAWLRGWTG
ncbi:ElyC/SanA/YdcF family protein [Halorhodospira neutriphila]|uniref:DUF218 domain-containing protein n=1 Tax=Halorhodospira neutriphila TaxID=168379 RepID=A0ABS1E7G9_9GAMM|nr:ElyC/SanA/YdcF family protein [Halorhodospira neutriphila]MBK1727460.1 hypothetical protein [Halorhodospira neutriphila]